MSSTSDTFSFTTSTPFTWRGGRVEGGGRRGEGGGRRGEMEMAEGKVRRRGRQRGGRGREEGGKIERGRADSWLAMYRVNFLDALSVLHVYNVRDS